MLKSFLYTAAALAILAAVPAAADVKVDLPSLLAPTLNAEGRLDHAVDLINAGKHAEAATELKSLIAHPAFAVQSVTIRAFAYFALGVALDGMQNYDDAYAAYIKVREVAPDCELVEYWQKLTSAALRTDHDSVAVEALIRDIELEPEEIRAYDIEFIYNVLNRADKLDDGGALRRSLLEHLWAAKYTSSDPFFSEQGLWLRLFRILVDAGEEAKARDVVTTLRDPDYLLALRVDNRYRPYLSLAPFGGDVTKALDADLSDLQARVKAHPDVLAGPQSLASALMQRNRLVEALAVADAAIAQVEKAPKDKPAFSDQDDQINWIYDTRSWILLRMGRGEEVLAAQIKARDVAMARGDDTVSQTINLGDMYYSFGRPKEALKAVETIRKAHDASAYGLMAAEEVRACAYAQLGDAANLALSLAYMKAHVDDGYGPYSSALQCAGDGDTLVQLIVGRLEDPETRNATLTDVQTYLVPPYQTPIDIRMAAVFEAVRQRADVRAAVAKYGVIESFPMLAGHN